MKKERKRRVKIQVISNEGYNINAELEKEMSLEEVLSTLEELGFSHLSEKINLQCKKHDEDIENKIEKIYNKFISITENHGSSIKSSEKFYENWIKMGFDIVDLKDATRENIPRIKIIEDDSRIITITEKETKEDTHTSNKQLLNLPSKEVSSRINTATISQEVDSTSVNKMRSTTDYEESITNRPNKSEEEAPEIRPLFGVETKDMCKFCSIFKDMGNIVCPNCGRALNLKIGS